MEKFEKNVKGSEKIGKIGRKSLKIRNNNLYCYGSDY